VAKPKAYECGGCCHEMSGYTKAELSDDGWEFYALPEKREFALCGECVERYAIRREQAAA
jgi:hypothetical protein